MPAPVKTSAGILFARFCKKDTVLHNVLEENSVKVYNIIKSITTRNT
jgi:hypothetical protein